jgi:hypothetical protein
VCSKTIRTARSPTSFGNRVGLFMTPSSQMMESPTNPRRFTDLPVQMSEPHREGLCPSYFQRPLRRNILSVPQKSMCPDQEGSTPTLPWPTEPAPQFHSNQRSRGDCHHPYLTRTRKV